MSVFDDKLFEYEYPTRRIDSGGRVDNHVQGLFIRAAQEEDGMLLSHTIKPGIRKGETVQTFEGNNVTIAMNAPCPHVLWYLYDRFPNRLPEDGTILQPMLDRLGIKPVLITMGNSGTREPRIFPARYEFWNSSCGSSFGIEIPKDLQNQGPVGFFDFLIGQPCTMESILVVGEVTGRIDTIFQGGQQIPPALAVFASPGDYDQLFIYLTYRFYRTTLRAELFADLEGEEDVEPFTFVRSFFREEDRFPTPGEFLAVACRPFRHHTWWFQETSPFLYSGEWFETDTYTSGIVEAVNEEGGEKTYDVRYRDQHITGVQSSDYREYAIGDRVAIIKGASEAGVMSWKDLGEFNEQYKIVPLSYYQEEAE